MTPSAAGSRSRRTVLGPQVTISVTGSGSPSSIDVGGRAPADQTALAPEEGAEVTLVLGAEDSGPKRFGHPGLAGGRRRNSREEQRQCNDGSGPFHPGIHLE